MNGCYSTAEQPHPGLKSWAGPGKPLTCDTSLTSLEPVGHPRRHTASPKTSPPSRHLIPKAYAEEPAPPRRPRAIHCRRMKRQWCYIVFERADLYVGLTGRHSRLTTGAQSRQTSRLTRRQGRSRCLTRSSAGRNRGFGMGCGGGQELDRTGPHESLTYLTLPSARLEPSSLCSC
jgi:hypothetical protein